MHAGVERKLTELTFGFTTNYQVFVVPADVYSLTVEVTGAEGGSGSVGAGGVGATVMTQIAVYPEQTLYLFVGQSGAALGGFNGGGDGDSTYTSYSGGGGGSKYSELFQIC